MVHHGKSSEPQRELAGDLTPLAGIKLTNLSIAGLTNVQDLPALQGMPLTQLNLEGLEKVRTFEVLTRIIHQCPVS